jgi:hypothetical protein
MRYRNIPAARRLMPLAGLLLATTLGGCVATYPPARYSYDYQYPNGYYAGYPAGYAYTDNDPARYANDTSHYPPVYFGPFNPHADGGGGG